MMLTGKKISFDTLHMALLLVLLRLAPELLLHNQHNRLIDTDEMLLGPTMGYRRSNFPSERSSTSWYTHLKTMDSILMDRSTLMRDQLDSLRRNSRQWSSVLAYYNDNNAQESIVRQRNRQDNNVDSRSEHSSDPSDSSSAHILEPQINESTPSSVESLLGLDLSPEDMDLIEILWKQDIDLGVSREAFSFRDNSDYEKIKDSDIIKPSLENTFDCDIKKPENRESKDSVIFNKFDGLNYTIDSETGEHVIHNEQLCPCDHNISVEHSLLNDRYFQHLSPALFPDGDDHTQELELPKLSPGTDIDEYIDNFDEALDEFLQSYNLISDNDEKLEDLINNPPEAESLLSPEDEGSEMYPSMEEYWQDISTALPLVGSTYRSTAQIVPRPLTAFSEATPDNYLPEPALPPTELLRDNYPHAMTGDSFQGSLVQNTEFAQHPPQLNNTFAYLPTLIGPTTLGGAVASSIATLTNDTDPMPDAVTTINGTFGLDFASMEHANQTSANEALLSEFLLDEDFQLMKAPVAPNVSSSDVVCSAFTRVGLRNDHMELSNDSASSSVSGNISSLSECNENRPVTLHEFSPDYLHKESFHTASDYGASQPSMNTQCQPPEASANDESFDAPSSSYRSNYTYCMQHNHSYHLPFTNGNSSPKPVIKDKSKSSTSDEETNRDERRANSMNIPIPICDIINLGIEEFNERLSKFELTEAQLTLIRDIRRRGKNKVAAQNCRKRKMDQISSLQHSLDYLQSERHELESERNQLLSERQSIKEKYFQLRSLVLQYSNSHIMRIPEIHPEFHDSSNSVTFNMPSTSNSDCSDSDTDVFSQGVRTKQKIDRK